MSLVATSLKSALGGITLKQPSDLTIAHASL